MNLYINNILQKIQNTVSFLKIYNLLNNYKNDKNVHKYMKIFYE